VPAAAVICFFLFGLYQKVWRYAGTHELVGVVVATGVSMIPFQVGAVLSGGDFFPRTGLVLAWIVCVFICGGVRLLLRMASESMGRPITNTRVLIVGVNDAGESIVRELTRGKGYTPVGFIDDNPAHRRLRVRGVPVLGGDRCQSGGGGHPRLSLSRPRAPPHRYLRGS
jgi:FlaA1/EpsC-like NDP-sugar epimerase